MTSAQRQAIDQQVATDDVPPEVSLPEIPVTKTKKKARVSKVTLNGAVVRPDGQVVLFLNGGVKTVASKKIATSGEFSFSIREQGKLVTLKPGQTVHVTEESE